MKHFTRAMILITATFACAADEPSPGNGLSYKLDSFYEGVCEETDGLRRCAKRIEMRAMEIHPDQAARRDDVLYINYKNKEPSVFESTSDVGYAYAGSVLGADIILEIVEEGWSALLLPSTGPVLRLPGLPLLSPDGHYFAALSLDIDAGYRPNVVEIWQLQNSRFSKLYEFTDFPKGGGPLRITWESPDSLKVQVVTPDQLYSGAIDDSITLTITKTFQGWTQSNTRKY